MDQARQWAGVLCEACEPRATFGDGRICRTCAARLGEVKPDTLSSWVSRDYVKNVRYEGRRPWFWPAEIITVADELHKREKARIAFLQAGVRNMQGVA